MQLKLGRSYRGERLTAERVGKVVTKIGKRSRIIVDEGNPRTGAPVKFASTHDLRRTFAQRLADSGLPPELVRRLMRHADIKTTERFYLQTNTQRDAGRIRDMLNAAASVNRLENRTIPEEEKKEHTEEFLREQIEYVEGL